MDIGSFTPLPNAVEGQVVVRFLPEASGYLHIGHVKAALVNQHYQNAFHGKLVFRFDDTNPEKEKENFEQAIEEDAKKLGLEWFKHTFSSDHFDLLIEKCEDLIKKGLAYVDDTPGEQMKQERDQRIESKNRDNSVEKNLSMWEEMKRGTDFGQKCCVRAKIDMSSNNGALRDPAIYRCKSMPHPRTKDKYKVYPTYDFTCPVVDSTEGITHVLRTSEYNDRDAQYYWFIDKLNIRKPIIVDFSRLNMTNTVLSKRKLTWFVEQNVVEGWDDPRMPTFRGILRRGMTVEGLKKFILAQGSSKSVVFMEWDKIWAFNKKVIDPIAPRYSAVKKENLVKVNVLGASPDLIEVALHPKNTELGKRKVKIGNTLLIDQLDAKSIKENENVTFINWGNLLIKKIDRDSKSGLVLGVEAQLNLDNKDFKKTLKVTWLETNSHVPAVFVYYDHLVVKPLMGKDDDFKEFYNNDSRMEVEMIVDDALKNLKKGDIIQVQRKGFFICDSQYDESTIKFTSRPAPVVLISIPDGSTDMNIFPFEVQEWKKKNQELAKQKSSKSSVDTSTTQVDIAKLNNEIKECGDQIRQLKSQKAAKDVIDGNVKKLLQLKEQFKKATGKDWVPNFDLSSVLKGKTNDTNSLGEASNLDAKIREQGDLIRKLKAEKSPKEVIEDNVKKLLALKEQFKAATGNEWKPPTDGPIKRSDNKNKNEAGEKQDRKSKEDKKQKKVSEKTVPQPSGDDKSGMKKQTRLGIEAKKLENTADWYQEVITKSEMIEYYDVSGCYILRPWAYSIWEEIQKFFDAKIKSIGVENCYFPMFVSKSALEAEKTHIADFAPEVAWVTKSGQSELAEPIAIRPTSETVMYPSFAKWVQSHRDLPIRLNQWCSVVRWEFKSPSPFIRTREFLWQEGHTAFATEKEAVDEVFTILGFYEQIFQDLLAIPVIKGRKTEKEKFAGGDMTTTCEAYVGTNGRGIQGATSHFLGQNFSKMFEIVFEDPIEPRQKRYAYQNSWGISTRTIGALVMIHGDDKGIVLPPRVASIQVVIIPCGITANTTDEDKNKLLDGCKLLEKMLSDAEVRVRCDLSDFRTPGWKFNHWELKGVPIRIELGPKDMQKKEFVAVRRDTGAKINYKIESVVRDCKSLLQDIQKSLFERAKHERDTHLIITHSWTEFQEKLDQKFIILAPFCGEISCEDKIKKDSAKEDVSDASGPLMGAKTLCVPLEQPESITDDMRCINSSCKNKPKFFTLFGRSY